jgi:cephalosporin hydroxylase
MHTDKIFEIQKKKRIRDYKKNKEFLRQIKKINNLFVSNKYSYNFNWLGTPIIQNPSDMIVVQEIIYQIKPDLIIETGIARSGSLIFYSSILNLINKKSKILGIDIDIRKHAKHSLKNHKIKNIITLEGSSISNETFNKVRQISKKFNKILVLLDSIHSHDHVLKELRLYAQLVTKNSYIIVFDTMPNYSDNKTSNFIKKSHTYKLNRKANAKTSIDKFLIKEKNFKIDEIFDYHSLTSNCINGFLKKK